MRWVKRILVILAIGFCLFYLVKQPEGAAAAVRTVLAALAEAFTSIVRFFTTLVK